MAYLDTGRSNNGGTEAINRFIDSTDASHAGFRNHGNYRLRILLIGGVIRHPHLR